MDLKKLSEPFPAEDIESLGALVGDRLIANTRKATNSCIEWQGHTAWNGYGRIAGRGTSKPIWQCHRLAFFLCVGPIPRGSKVLHNCDNPRCINPAHLRIGTQRENVRDRVDRRRSATGERAGRAKLSYRIVAEIRAIHVKRCLTHGAKALAAKYGVAPNTVRAVVEGRSWVTTEGQQCL